MQWLLSCRPAAGNRGGAAVAAAASAARSVSQKREKRSLVRVMAGQIPLEYIVLAAIAAILILVLILLLCMLCCQRPAHTQDETETGTRVEYVPDRIPNASVYVTPAQTEEKGQEATATVLMDAGYTGTQLLEHGLVREATKTELLDTGYTKSQLRDANILPAEKQKRKKLAPKPQASVSGFKSKPLKFESQVDADDEPVRRTKTKKRAAEVEDEDAEVTVRKKKSPSGQYDQFFERERILSVPVAKAVPVRQPENRRKMRSRISDSKERIPVREKKRSDSEQRFNLTTLF